VLVGRVSDDVQAAPYLRGKPAASIFGVTPISFITGITAGTSDSPTCSRGKTADSNTATSRPARAR
jgi:hypothetical protein